MELFWDLRQERRIDVAEAMAAEGKVRSESVATEVAQLERRVDRLLLVNMALWSLLKDLSGLTDEQLSQRVAQIDAADGSADGRVTATRQTCPACAKVLSLKHQKCLHCGYIPPSQDVFAPVSR